LDRASTAAYAIGYIGGGILLLVNLAWILRPQTFGMPDTLTAKDPAVVERPFGDLPTLEELERRYLVHVLDAAGGNRTDCGADRRPTVGRNKSCTVDGRASAGSGHRPDPADPTA